MRSNPRGESMPTKRSSLLRVGVAALVLIAIATQAHAAEPAWEPDEKVIKSIEASLKLPSRAPWAPGPLDSYARYYIGMIRNGNRVIYGHFLRGRMTKEKPGIYLRQPPSFRTGGGCDQIQMWYDVDAHQMIQIQCYGLG